MAPKRTRRLPIADWSWVGTEVADAKGILPIHHWRAAGLEGLAQCPLETISRPPSAPISPSSSTVSSITGKVREKGSAENKHLSGSSACTAKRCRSWPRCYNHLGAKEVLEWTKEDLILDRLREQPQKRDGPAGLKNQGALCYANAFLQVWYHNVAFRNGVYQAITSVPDELTPLHHLALIFASMENSDRAVVNPIGLVEAIGLNKGDQQDAAEFSKLFTSLIENSFKKQGNAAVKNLVCDMFEGKIEHQTQCTKCKYTSKRQESFLELDLNIINNSTVQQCLAALTRVEILTGENKYHCPKCQSLQTAQRTSLPMVLPPVLNLSLMRFTYNGTGRVKNKAMIKYAKQLTLGKMEYELRAVVTHQGTSAHHGHFVCDVYDESEGVWLHCSDEEITNLDDRKKRPRIVSDGPEMTSSKDAYLLVYTRKDDVQALPPHPSVLRMVEVDNARFEQELNARALREIVLEDDYGHIRDAKRDVINALPGTDHIVPTDQLEKWLSITDFDDLFKPWSFENITCEHGEFDPHKSAEVRLISAEAFDKLSVYSELPDLQICPVCVEEDFARRLVQNTLVEQVEQFDELNSGGGDYVLPKRWFDGWRKGEIAVPPTDREYTLFCDHGFRFERGQKTVLVSPESVALLHSVFGTFEVCTSSESTCGECSEVHSVDQDAEMAWKEMVKDERVIQKELKNVYPSFGLQFYLLPFFFVEEWETWMRKGGTRPTLDMDLCPHGKLDWDPMMVYPKFLSEKGWKEVVKRYGAAKPVRIRFDANPLQGKRTNVVEVIPGVCEACRVRKAGEFEKATVRLVIQEADTGQNGVLDRTRKTRSQVKEIELEVTKSTTMKAVKLELCARYGLSPMYQSISHNGRELVSEDTVESAHILAGDELVCKVLEEKGLDEVMVNVGGGEGFGGTALVGNTGRACPQCTYVNPVGEGECEVCQMPFQ